MGGNIDGGRQIPVNINGDNGSNGHITWKATNLDRSKCGSGDVSSLGSGATVTIKDHPRRADRHRNHGPGAYLFCEMGAPQ